VAQLIQEVEENAHDIEALTGSRPAWFRSGTAFYDDAAVKIIHALGFNIAGYTIAGDAGATLPAQKVAERLLQAQGGEIILCHLNHPESGTGKGLALALPVLKERGFHFVLLK
jgi:peptidoglycan/xylan/chitin deacetylase (PgdA/CDA1 family)